MTSRNAHAYPFYVDWQTGGTQLRSTDLVFGSGTQDASDFGIGANLGLFYIPFDATGGMEFQVGLSQQYLSATQGSMAYGILAPHAMARVQLLNLYGSAGIAPLVWYRSAGQTGIDGFTKAQGIMSYLGEIGLLYSATPKFSMGGALNLNWFSVDGALTPSPAASITFVMRFYFGDKSSGGGGSGGRRALEYDGWRYIGK